METLEQKIQQNQDTIARLEAQIAMENEADTFGRIRIVETKAEIRTLEQRIARLQARLAGTEEQGPTEAQIHNIEYVNSRRYDSD